MLLWCSLKCEKNQAVFYIMIKFLQISILQMIIYNVVINLILLIIIVISYSLSKALPPNFIPDTYLLTGRQRCRDRVDR